MASNILYTDSQFCYPNKKLAIYIFLSFFLVSCYSKTIPLHPRLTLLAWNSVKYISSSKFSDIDECYSAYNPCRNGGTCVNSVGGQVIAIIVKLDILESIAKLVKNVTL